MYVMSHFFKRDYTGVLWAECFCERQEGICRYMGGGVYGDLSKNGSGLDISGGGNGTRGIC